MKKRTLTSKPALRSLPAVAGLLLATGLSACGGAAAGAGAAVRTPDPGQGTARVQSAGQAPGTGGLCGYLTTAGGFQAAIRIQRGSVSCANALDIYTRYYAALANGEAPGNGGGGPVNVSGWICQSPPYTERFQPSTCVSGDEVVAAYIVQ